jgi:hypothetical protein
MHTNRRLRVRTTNLRVNGNCCCNYFAKFACAALELTRGNLNAIFTHFGKKNADCQTIIIYRA